MCSVAKSWTLLSSVCLVTMQGARALSFVEIQSQNIRGHLKFEFKSNTFGCLRSCHLSHDCTYAVYYKAENKGSFSGVCSLYSSGNDAISTNGIAYEIRRDAVYNKCEPKFTFGTLVSFTRTPEADGTTTATGCTPFPVGVYANPEGIHFYMTIDNHIVLNLTKKCEIHFLVEKLSGCSSIPIFTFREGRRMFFGSGYAASNVYLILGPYTSSAICASNTPTCQTNVILREYKNTAMEDYVYLPEGTVHPQLQFTEVDIPIHVHYTDCSLASLDMP
ncbi:unnamed protein product [Nippostrongylus brasiliensis]|uniref:Apple domain-containing protein n=1 Tax=Nippostrongylus brasiliensis TaxID=27835 RepID=A0A0N4YHH5_NIPBR|nr:unnamed protein product [Nippostrongylus brasiliensis]